MALLQAKRHNIEFSTRPASEQPYTNLLRKRVIQTKFTPEYFNDLLCFHDSSTYHKILDINWTSPYVYPAMRVGRDLLPRMSE